jgi:hypothetical protein
MISAISGEGRVASVPTRVSPPFRRAFRLGGIGSSFLSARITWIGISRGQLDAVFHRFAHDKENLPEMPEILLVVRVERETGWSL